MQHNILNAYQDREKTLREEIFKIRLMYNDLDDEQSVEALALVEKETKLKKKLDAWLVKMKDDHVPSIMESVIEAPNLNGNDNAPNLVEVAPQPGKSKIVFPTDLPIYSNTQTVFVKNFLVKLENVLLSANIPKDLWCMGLLKSVSNNLIASNFVRGLIDDASIKKDWSIIQSRFALKFQRMDLKESIRSQFNKLEMGPKESLHDFLVKYYEFIIELNINESDQYQIAKLVDSVHDPIRRIYLQNKKTLESILKVMQLKDPELVISEDFLFDSVSRVIEKLLAAKDSMSSNGGSYAFNGLNNSASSYSNNNNNRYHAQNGASVYKPPFLRGNNNMILNNSGSGGNAPAPSAQVNNPVHNNGNNSVMNNNSNDASVGGGKPNSTEERSTILIRCLYCKQLGHFVKNCPTAPPQIKNNTSSVVTRNMFNNNLNRNLQKPHQVGLVTELDSDASYWEQLEALCLTDNVDNEVQDSEDLIEHVGAVKEFDDISEVDEVEEKLPTKLSNSNDLVVTKSLDDFATLMIINGKLVPVYVDSGNFSESMVDPNFEGFDESLIIPNTKKKFLNLAFVNTVVEKGALVKFPLRYGNYNFEEVFSVGKIYQEKVFPYHVMIGRRTMKKLGISLSGLRITKEDSEDKAEESIELSRQEDDSAISMEVEVRTDEAKKLEEAVKDLMEINGKLSNGCNVLEAKIILRKEVDLQNLFQKNYNVSGHKLHQVDEVVYGWLEDKIIEVAPEGCSFNNSLVVVNKSDGGVRVCLDFRRLNNLLHPEFVDRQVIPEIWKVIQNFFVHKVYFTELDLSNAFLQVSLAPESRNYTAFTWRNVQYRFRFTPFGLKFVSSLFQRLMLLVLSKYSDFVFIYIDNIVIGSRSWEQHLEHVRLVITALNEANLKIKPSKVKYCQTRIHILGHVIQGGTISISDTRKQQIQNFITPIKSKESLHSFLGIVVQTLPFIPDFAEIAYPLYEALKGNEGKIIWTQECQQAVERFKRIMEEELVLAVPDLSRKFILQTDASRRRIGAVLLQYGVDNRVQLVENWSRKLKPFETRYSVYKLELLGVVSGLLKFKYWLLGKEFILQCDHKPLSYLFSSPSLSPILANWLEIILPFNFVIEHIPGTVNKMADFLSRYEDEEHAEQDQRELVLKVGEILLDSDETLKLFSSLDVDEELKKELIRKVHDMGHMGSHKLIKTLQVNYACVWLDIYKLVEEITKKCLVCLKYNVAQAGYFPLKTHQATLPMELVVFDLMEMLLSHNGYVFGMIVMDVFSGYTWIIPLKQKKSENILCHLYEIFIIFGFPKMLKSDNEICLKSEELNNFFEKLGVNRKFSIVNSSKSNGAGERVIRTVRSMLNKVSYPQAQNWDMYVPFVQYILNHSIRNKVELSAFHIMFGRRDFQFVPTNNKFDPTCKDYTDEEIGEVISLWMSQWENIHSTLYPYIGSTLKKLRENANKVWMEKHRMLEPSKLKVGSIVLLRDINKSQKWEPIYNGPFLIVEKVENGFKLMDSTGEVLPNVIPMEHIKPTILEELEATFEVKNIEAHHWDGTSFVYLIDWKNSWIQQSKMDEFKPQVKKVLKMELKGNIPYNLVSWKKSWEPEQSLDAAQLINQYWKTHSI
jgi:hypothetical protein